MNRSSLKTAVAALAVFLCTFSNAQSIGKFDYLLKQSEMETDLEYIASDQAAGRASGTRAKQSVEQFMVRRFKSLGLKPYNWSYTQSFRYNDTILIRNVVGYLPAVAPSDEYIIIGAHYDHIGTLAGRVYNGADDNASGVTAMLSLARMFAQLKAEGVAPRKNILFVAFDGKELSMSGSEYFVRNLNIPASKITCAINMDMLGTNLVPTGINSDYLIALGEKTLGEKYRGYLSFLTKRALYKMDLDLTFYGSRNFTDIMYRSGDHNSFAKAGIPAVFFTSAFHEHTYKPTDKIDIINFPLLRRRTLVIYNFVLRLCE